MLINKFRNFSLLIVFVLIIGLVPIVKAQAPPPTAIESPIGATTFGGLIDSIATWVFNIAIPLATLMFLVGGFQFLVSGGDEEKVKRAKRTMTWAAVGLAVCLIGKGFTSLIEEFFGVE